MSRLGKVLSGSFETYTINGEEFKLRSLCGKHLDLVQSDATSDPVIAYKIAHASLSMTYSDITMDEVLEVDLKHITKMVELVMKASGFDDEKLEQAKNDARKNTPKDVPTEEGTKAR